MWPDDATPPDLGSVSRELKPLNMSGRPHRKVLLRSQLIVTELPAKIAREYHAQVRKWAAVTIELA